MVTGDVRGRQDGRLQGREATVPPEQARLSAMECFVLGDGDYRSYRGHRGQRSRKVSVSPRFFAGTSHGTRQTCSNGCCPIDKKSIKSCHYRPQLRHFMVR